MFSHALSPFTIALDFSHVQRSGCGALAVPSPTASPATRAAAEQRAGQGCTFSFALGLIPNPTPLRVSSFCENIQGKERKRTFSRSNLLTPSLPLGNLSRAFPFSLPICLPFFSRGSSSFSFPPTPFAQDHPEEPGSLLQLQGHPWAAAPTLPWAAALTFTGAAPSTTSSKDAPPTPKRRISPGLTFTAAFWTWQPLTKVPWGELKSCRTKLLSQAANARAA